MRYPQDILSGTDIRAIPRPANNQQWIYPNNVFTFRGSDNIKSNVGVKISFGDFTITTCLVEVQVILILCLMDITALV